MGTSVHRTGNKRFETVDLAYLSAGDMVGGAALFQEEHKYGVVAVPTTTVLRIKQKDIHTLLHLADVEALK
jgi:CRP-like cAMP-binding protein